MGRILVLTASMGGGHDGVATELARRLRGRAHGVDVVDILTLFPWRCGDGMRAGYRGMLRAAPWFYDAIYRGFFVPHDGVVVPDASPAVHLAANGLRRLITAAPPDVVVSTFHLAGQAANMLRREGSLRAPSVILVTEAEAHALWRDPTTDLYLCVYPGQAEKLRRDLQVDARRVPPVVRPVFQEAATRTREISTSNERWLRPRVLVTAGSWGVGHPAHAAHILARTGRYRPVVLCGHNDRLRRRLSSSGCDASGWVTDVAPLMAQASVLVENAGGGLTCWEAFACGLPVVTFDPIPGHGRVGARRLQQSGLSAFPTDARELVRVVDDLSTVLSSSRRALRAAEAALFDHDAADAADVVSEIAAAHHH